MGSLEVGTTAHKSPPFAGVVGRVVGAGVVAGRGVDGALVGLVVGAGVDGVLVGLVVGAEVAADPGRVVGAEEGRVVGAEEGAVVGLGVEGAWVEGAGVEGAGVVLGLGVEAGAGVEEEEEPYTFPESTRAPGVFPVNASTIVAPLEEVNLRLTGKVNPRPEVEVKV
jgi:hypothetical protein